ncbi:Zn-ribbon domain-containing OB-fold protein [[Mycobacterium] zoologicum]|uniref:Zn-ribbon domain-containing OB-fold protein n=1 Tax=[Mycobacterium] zoologicum TaxID=2872311 RepID=UPI002CE12E39|nr:OB-fold domain-containing protein [Mycolicibacter sp. MYC101]MEB3065131.1 OB-fold domain-containing protein [Mycolicibacter sp. MYC101]
MSALITEGLFRVDGDRAVLFGSRRRATGVVKFPAERPELFDGAPDIQADIEPIELSTEGTLYTYTTQEFAPPLPYKGDRSPGVFQPYVVGFVELAEGVLVETLIVDVDPADLHIGQPLISTTTTLQTADGESLLTFAFRPAGAG